MTGNRLAQLNRARNRSFRPNQLAAAKVWLEHQANHQPIMDALPALVTLKLLAGVKMNADNTGGALNWLRKHSKRRNADPLHADWADALLDEIERVMHAEGTAGT